MRKYSTPTEATPISRKEAERLVKESKEKDGKKDDREDSKTDKE